MNPLGDINQLYRADKFWIVFVVEELRIIGQRSTAYKQHGERVDFIVVHIDDVPQGA